MNNEANQCTCSSDGYAPDCPQAFYQGGKLLHSIESETKLKPRIFVKPELARNNHNLESCEDNDVRQGDTTLIRNHSTATEAKKGKILIDRFEAMNYGDDYLFNEVENSFPEGLSLNASRARLNERGNIVDGNSMRQQNREVLRKYEALRIGDRELTDLSIGGYQVDLSKAAQKASAVAPLPPAKLPRIYLDSDMNFLHHFFQGLDRLLGRDRVLNVVNQERYYTTSDLVLLPMIEDIVKVGYERKDTNLTVFTKSVLSSTFECDDKTGPDQDQRGLVVAANLWGFQYIECGMELKEADLRMWLSINYNHFRTMYFNTFKDSGMPAFAMEGVQARYEAVPDRRVDIGDRVMAIAGPAGREVLYQSPDYIHDDDTRSMRSRRKRHTRRQEPTIGALLFGRGGR